MDNERCQRPETAKKKMNQSMTRDDLKIGRKNRSRNRQRRKNENRKKEREMTRDDLKIEPQKRERCPKMT
jgi:hypothetical protein